MNLRLTQTSIRVHDRLFRVSNRLHSESTHLSSSDFRVARRLTQLNPHKGGHCGISSTKLASITSPNYFSVLKNNSPTFSSPLTTPEPKPDTLSHEENDAFYSFSDSNMFGKQPRNVSSRSSSVSTTSLTRRLNIVDGSKLPPGLNKPISQTISIPTVATSPITAEGSLTTPRESSAETTSKAEGKKKVRTVSQPSESSSLPHNPTERAPVFVTPPPNSLQFRSISEQSHPNAEVHTPVFVAPSSIATQTRSQPRILHPNMEADTAFEVDVDDNLRETESTPRPSQFICRGMENGYSLSPMYNLWLEYCNEGEASKSTQSRVVFYATKPSLARDEVVDRGTNTSTERYMVHKPLLEQICRTVSELQVFIQHMAGLIDERTTYFQVDPDDTLLKVLGGAETISQLHAAWLGLTSRLGAAQKFMIKYQQEYQNASVPSSPVSTNPDIHKYISELPDIDDKLRNIHGTIPRHASKLSRDARQQLTETKGKWDNIIPTPPWLATPAQKSSSPISDVPARTSYKAASSFTLPDEVESSTPVQRKQSSTPWKGSKAVQFAPQPNPSEPPQSALMSSGTPFKSSKGLFLQGDESNLGPFPSAAPNRNLSASNFLYGTNEIPVFSPDGIQFSGFSYPSNANSTPSNPSAQPITSTPWNRGPVPAGSFHSMLSQRREESAAPPIQGSLQARTQVSTSRVATESTNNIRRSDETARHQSTANSVGERDSDQGVPGYPGEATPTRRMMTLHIIQADTVPQSATNAG